MTEKRANESWPFLGYWQPPVGMTVLRAMSEPVEYPPHGDVHMRVEIDGKHYTLVIGADKPGRELIEQLRELAGRLGGLTNRELTIATVFTLHSGGVRSE